MRLGPENIQFLTAANELYVANGYIVVVSGADNTEVTVRDPIGLVWSRTLGRLQTYTYTTTTLGADLTGYMVTSDKPVSVFSGTNFNKLLSYRGQDSMYVSLPPVMFWGTVYFVPSILERPQPQGYALRVIALGLTEVRDLEGGTLAILDTQEVYESRPDDHGDVGGGIECSQPCLVIQYMMGWKYDNSNIDAAMRVVPSVDSCVK